MSRAGPDTVFQTKKAAFIIESSFKLIAAGTIATSPPSYIYKCAVAEGLFNAQTTETLVKAGNLTL